MIFNQPPRLYDSAEWTQAQATDYDVRAQALFANCKNPDHIIIRCDQTITVKFQTTTNPSITISANTAFEIDLRIFQMYITTTGSTAIKVLLTEHED